MQLPGVDIQVLLLLGSVGFVHNEPTATIDLETRSVCSLKHCGAYKYAQDPTTEVLCMAFRLPYWTEGHTSLWHPAFPKLGIPESDNDSEILELIEWVTEGGLVEAHNAQFERALWGAVMVPRYGWMPISPNSIRCSAAKAAAHALPRKLSEAGDALHLGVQKDDEGHRLMLKLSKPRKPRKKEREEWATLHGNEPHPTLWWEDLASFQRLWQYCAQDVLAEECLSHSLDDLSPTETPNYVLDQTVNQRGFRLDLEAVEIALDLIVWESRVLNQELATLTGGLVERATQRDRMKKWLATEGLVLYDTKGATIDDILTEAESGEPSEDPFAASIVGSVSPAARRALEILRTLGRSSTAKYETMLDWACGDGRVRGGLLYHGASTGRWSGSGVQPHNFPKGTIKGFDMEAAWALIKTGDRDAINAVYPSVMETLACALRGAIVPSKGHELFVADYAGIEVRVLWWAADDKVGLKLLSTGADPYCALASDVYGRPITKADKDERQLGKAGVLGCGYQMGAAKFVATAATYGLTIDDEMSQTVVNTYRSKFHRVKSFWYETEDAACLATSQPGRIVKNGKCQWQRVVDTARSTDFLYCILPNGRRLSYPFPELRPRETPWGAIKTALTFMAVNPHNKKWMRQTTYGGSLVENIVQAISRDILADALHRLEQSGIYIPVLSVHDETVCEAKIGHGDIKEYEKLLTTPPTWAADCPIGAEGWRGFRYKK